MSWVNSSECNDKYMFLNNAEIFIPSGWKLIVDEFCHKVQEICQNYRNQGFKVYCKIMCIKEKFASLRIIFADYG